MKWKLKIILIIVLILLLASNSGATKEAIKEIENGVSETVTLNSDEYLTYSFSLWEDYGINVTMEALEGGNIDIFREDTRNNIILSTKDAKGGE